MQRFKYCQLMHEASHEGSHEASHQSSHVTMVDNKSKRKMF